MKNDKLKTDLEKAMAKYAKSVGTGFEEALRDALTELKHIADKYKVDFQDRVDAAVEVAKEEDSEDAKEFEVELYELHSSKVKVQARNKAEAILKALKAESEPVDDSSEYIEMADGYGVFANDAGLALTKEELAEVTKELGIKPCESIPSFRQVEEVG
jgi:hypothetical protein